MALRVRTCCSASLRTGTVLIGFLDFLGAFVLLILASIAALNYRSYRPYWDDQYALYHPMDDMQGVYVTMAVVSGILMVVDVLLLIGVFDTKPKLILPWIYYSYVNVLSNVVCALTYGVYSYEYYYEYYGYASISCSIIYLVLKIYLLLVVWSFYKEMMKTVGDKGANVTVYPQPFPNGPQNHPNGQPMYPNGQLMYPNGQMQHSNQPQPYPNQEQPFPNAQQPYPQPYTQPLPSVENMNRDL